MRAALQLFATRSLHEITLEEIAAHIGVTTTAVLEQIPDLDQLLIAAIQHWYGERMAAVQVTATRDGTVLFLRELLMISISDPTCTRMVLTAAGIAGVRDNSSAEALQQMWVRAHAIVQRALTCDVAVGREPSTIHPAHGAEQLLSIYEGLQFQWLFRPNMDLLAAYDRAIARLRRGWSEA